ncbi:hypothetical protein [Nonomuraea roseoviolacea]|uniref:Uncharacterized protein n=1 Tax=Nonomuraea roseoviolacea subsp. carminata TaxID=160689 RepID=A0ABT1JYP4_9ACTN|nr:hypothetical protein [Nonomuraea roseoviolacea]MCP2346856.1 hypothetical protein [Nonomuraea roseoviolacea subsp. carminata]
MPAVAAVTSGVTMGEPAPRGPVSPRRSAVRATTAEASSSPPARVWASAGEGAAAIQMTPALRVTAATAARKPEHDSDDRDDPDDRDHGDHLDGA